MSRRRGGGGRQERTDSPASSGGVHPKERNIVEHPDPRSGPGCTPSQRGYRAVTPPVTYGAEADAAAHPKRGDNWRGAEGGPTGPVSMAGPCVSDRTGYADETEESARLERSGRRARSGRDGLRRPCATIKGSYPYAEGSGTAMATTPRDATIGAAGLY